MQRRLRKVRRRDGFLPNDNLDLARASSSLCFDPRLATPKQDQQAPLSTAFSRAIRTRFLISAGRAISLEIAYDAFATVSTSNCLTGGSIVPEGAGVRPSRRARVPFFELLYFSVGAPTVVAVPRIPEIGVGECLEAARRVKLCGDLIGEHFILDKAVRTGRADGLFVQLNGIESSPFDAGNLRPHQCGAVFEILRAMFRPYCQVFVVSSEGIEMLPALSRCRRIAARCAGKCTVKFVFRHLKTR
jgi:hypothetical protein